MRQDCISWAASQEKFGNLQYTVKRLMLMARVKPSMQADLNPIINQWLK